MNNFAGSKILVIEDETSIRENIVEMLTMAGYQVNSAENGFEGISQFMVFQPDLILCDVMMPKVNGYNVLKTIRNSGTQANTPFIFLTSMSEKIHIREGMLTGADDYLTKPFLFQDILSAIETRLKREYKRRNELKEQLLQYRREFNNISSHEYNTPFGSIFGFLHLLTDNFSDFSETEALSMLEMITVSCKRLKKTLDNSQLYQDLNQIDPGDNWHKQYAEGQFLVTERWITDICHTVAHYCEINLGYTIPFNIAVQNANLRISEMNLQKIFAELLDNAFKFSMEKSCINIVGLTENNTYKLIIANQGREFKQEHIEQVGPYRQFERKKYEQQGSGLGLWIAKELTQLNRGQLSISGNEGHTLITVCIPLVNIESN